jgi:cytochrome c-type biogenesis protein CcmH
MTAFILIAAVMVAIALAWVLWPLLRPSTVRAVERRAANLTIYKDQFADLDADLARGSISKAQYNEAKAELERRLLEEGRAEASSSAPIVGGRKTALALGLAVPVIAGLLYWQLGAPDAFSPLATAPQNQHQLSGDQVDEMVTRLRERLDKEPDNVEGWLVLARTYYTQRNFPEAAAAYERLTKLLPDEPDLLADYADALAMAHGRKISGKPMELVKKALAIDPNHWKALAMAGTEAFVRKDYKTAVAYWERLRNTAGDAPIAKQIQASIDEARRLGDLPASSPAPIVAAGPKAAAKTGDQPAAKSAAPAAAAAKSVSGTLSLAAELKAKARPDDAVFLFARPADGTKMPIAIVRAQVKDLPLKFSLDDSQAMSPQVKLSNFDEVIVAARVSKSGNAMPASGDLEGLTKPVKVGATGVALTIDRVLP